MHLEGLVEERIWIIETTGGIFWSRSSATSPFKEFLYCNSIISANSRGLSVLLNDVTMGEVQAEELNGVKISSSIKWSSLHLTGFRKPRSYLWRLIKNGVQSYQLHYDTTQ